MSEQQMKWNNQRQAYIGEWSDGRKFEVSGDAWSEDLRDAVKAILREHPEKSEDEARDEAEREMLDPLAWTDDMFGVNVLE